MEPGVMAAPGDCTTLVSERHFPAPGSEVGFAMVPSVIPANCAERQMFHTEPEAKVVAFPGMGVFHFTMFRLPAIGFAVKLHCAVVLPVSQCQFRYL